MKSKKLVVAFAFLLFISLCGYALLLKEGRAAGVAVSSPKTGVTNLSAAAAGPIVSNPPTVVHIPVPKGIRAGQLLTAHNHVPINFYGKLEDQYGNPVAGAIIKGSIQVNTGFRQTTEWPVTKSDKNGCFQFHGRGKNLDMVPEKKGYALASLNGGGNYSELYPPNERAPYSDISHPIIVKMWKLMGAEPLLKIDKTYHLSYTGNPFYVDLLTGKIVAEGGDLKVTVHRSGGEHERFYHPDWDLKVEAVDGGVIKTNLGATRVMYMAPEVGYVPFEFYSFSTNDLHHWVREIDDFYFVKSRNGMVYSKLEFSFGMSRDPSNYMYLMLNGVANTNSSRNWEGDPASYNPDVAR